jgi:4-carboxymuconolactone decarboxylase
MSSQQHDRGLEMRKQVLGASHVERTLAATDQYTEALQQLVNEFCWGAVWARPGLEPRIRCMLTVTMLTALNRSTELQTHIRAALGNGVTREEIVEIMLQAGVYCGMPAAVEGLRVARAVFAEAAAA